MTRWFAVAPVELDFTERSRYSLDQSAVVAAPPERVFALMADGGRMGEWFHDFVACRWTSAAPHGVGSTREIELAALTVKERFLAWDPGRRLAFRIDAITLPLVSKMIEDMRLEPVDGGRSTRVSWRVHYEPTLLMRLVHPIGRRVFARMFAKSLAGLARLAARG